MKADGYPGAEAFVPARLSLKSLREAAAGCQGCQLHKNGTQTVFGEGPVDAHVMMLGEQPGDYEDRKGRPFIGPAGQLLDRALADADIPRKEVYVTNVVKHFKWEQRGKRRIHSKPSAREIAACRPWLAAEVQVVKPAMLVCLGATAAQAIFGSGFRITRQRGEVRESNWAPWTMATVHPSSLLRMPSELDRRKAYARFVQDLEKVADQLRRGAEGSSAVLENVDG